MVDEMKKQMGRFEQLIGFKGTLDVTSNESMKELIRALRSKYRRDVQATLRLHRLEFFYDLVEKNKNDETVNIEPKDIDDWKDLLTLSKIYYVLQHPRSEGLRWKRYITKKKTIDQFTDIDLIEWRVSQNFRLRGLEEWAQRRSDARRLAQVSGFLVDDDVQDWKGLEELFDSTAPKHQVEEKKAEKRPFKFQDECVEDWTESYSDDSEYSGIEDFEEAMDDFPSDDLDRELDEADEDLEREESISELLSKYPKFSQYRESIFEEMDEAKTFEEWFPLYDKTRLQMQPEVKEEKPEESSVKSLPKIDEETEEEDLLDDSKDSSVKEDKVHESQEPSDNKTENGDMKDDIKEVITDAPEEKVAGPEKEATEETDTDASEEKVASSEKEAMEDEATDGLEEKVASSEKEAMEDEATDGLEEKVAGVDEKEVIEETATDEAEASEKVAIRETEDTERAAKEKRDISDEETVRENEAAEDDKAVDDGETAEEKADGEDNDSSNKETEGESIEDDFESAQDEED